MTAREREIFFLIKENPMVTQEEIAEKLGISRSAVSVHISSLLRQKALRGRGYVVNEEDYHVVIGTAGMDVLGTTEGQLSDSVTEKIINYYGRIDVRFGGAAHNIAEAMCRLGEHVRLMAPVCGDMFGRQVLEHCGELHINVDDCLYLSDVPQSIMLQIRNEAIDQHTAVVNYFSEERMTPEFFASKARMLRNARGIVVTDIISPESADYLLSAYGESGLWFVYSGVISRLDKLSEVGRRAPCAYMNLRAAAHLTGVPVSEGGQAVARRLRELGFREVFISCDNRAILHVTPDSCVSCPTLPNTKSDSERGKDLFVAGLAATAQSGMTLAERVRFSSVVSQLGLGGEGTRAISRDAVEQAVDHGR